MKVKGAPLKVLNDEVGVNVERLKTTLKFVQAAVI